MLHCYSVKVSQYLTVILYIHRDGTILESSTVHLYINVVSLDISDKGQGSSSFILAFIVGPSLAVVLLIGADRQT